MMSSPISSVSNSDPIATTTAHAPTTPTVDPGQLSSTAFLKLLVAQLQYQDPSKPVDTSSFMTETATLTQVQTMQQMTAVSNQMLTATQNQSATAMVGKTVTYTDSAGAVQTGAVTAATLSGATPTLTVNGAEIAMSKVATVRATA